MLDSFVNWVHNTTQSISTEVKKFKNKRFLEAAVAGCAMVAASDGTISAEEKRKMMGFISQSEALSVFSTDEVVPLFEKYSASYDFDWEIGKAHALKTISQIKENGDEARLMVRVCCAIGAADGNFDENEKNVIREICNELGLDPADFKI